MSSIILELQDLASDGKCPVDQLLRKAQLVATKLNIADRMDWIRNELDGYPSKVSVPDYRVVGCELTAVNPVTGRTMPVIFESAKNHSEFSQIEVRQAIGQIISLTTGSKGILQASLTSRELAIVNRSMDYPFSCHKRLSPTSIFGILDAVRNGILTWSLDLEKSGILGEGMTFSREEKVKAMTTQNIHVHQFNGILGNMTGGTVTQNFSHQVIEGDLSKLTQILEQLGLSDNETAALASAIKSDPQQTKSKEFGPHVSEWFGSIMSKAAAGTLAIGIDVASKVIPTAILAYYGVKGE